MMWNFPPMPPQPLNWQSPQKVKPQISQEQRQLEEEFYDKPYQSPEQFEALKPFAYHMNMRHYMPHPYMPQYPPEYLYGHPHPYYHMPPMMMPPKYPLAGMPLDAIHFPTNPLSPTKQPPLELEQQQQQQYQKPKLDLEQQAQRKVSLRQNRKPQAGKDPNRREDEKQKLIEKMANQDFFPFSEPKKRNRLVQEQKPQAESDNPVSPPSNNRHSKRKQQNQDQPVGGQQFNQIQDMEKINKMEKIRRERQVNEENRRLIEQRALSKKKGRASVEPIERIKGMQFIKAPDNNPTGAQVNSGEAQAIGNDAAPSATNALNNNQPRNSIGKGVTPATPAAPVLSNFFTTQLEDLQHKLKRGRINQDQYKALLKKLCGYYQLNDKQYWIEDTKEKPAERPVPVAAPFTEVLVVEQAAPVVQSPPQAIKDEVPTDKPVQSKQVEGPAVEAQPVNFIDQYFGQISKAFSQMFKKRPTKQEGNNSDFVSDLGSMMMGPAAGLLMNPFMMPLIANQLGGGSINGLSELWRPRASQNIDENSTISNMNLTRSKRTLNGRNSTNALPKSRLIERIQEENSQIISLPGDVEMVPLEMSRISKQTKKESESQTELADVLGLPSKEEQSLIGQKKRVLLDQKQKTQGKNEMAQDRFFYKRYKVSGHFVPFSFVGTPSAEDQISCATGEIKPTNRTKILATMQAFDRETKNSIDHQAKIAEIKEMVHRSGAQTPRLGSSHRHRRSSRMVSNNLAQLSVQNKRRQIEGDFIVEARGSSGKPIRQSNSSQDLAKSSVSPNVKMMQSQTSRVSKSKISYHSSSKKSSSSSSGNESSDSHVSPLRKSNQSRASEWDSHHSKSSKSSKSSKLSQSSQSSKSSKSLEKSKHLGTSQNPKQKSNKIKKSRKSDKSSESDKSSHKSSDSSDSSQSSSKSKSSKSSSNSKSSSLSSKNSSRSNSKSSDRGKKQKDIAGSIISQAKLSIVNSYSKIQHSAYARARRKIIRSKSRLKSSIKKDDESIQKIKQSSPAKKSKLGKSNEDEKQSKNERVSKIERTQKIERKSKIERASKIEIASKIQKAMKNDKVPKKGKRTNKEQQLDLASKQSDKQNQQDSQEKVISNDSHIDSNFFSSNASVRQAQDFESVQQHRPNIRVKKYRLEELKAQSKLRDMSDHSQGSKYSIRSSGSVKIRHLKSFGMKNRSGLLQNMLGKSEYAGNRWNRQGGQPYSRSQKMLRDSIRQRSFKGEGNDRGQQDKPYEKSHARSRRGDDDEDAYDLNGARKPRHDQGKNMLETDLPTRRHNYRGQQRKRNSDLYQGSKNERRYREYQDYYDRGSSPQQFRDTQQFPGEQLSAYPYRQFLPSQVVVPTSNPQVVVQRAPEVIYAPASPVQYVVQQQQQPQYVFSHTMAPQTQSFMNNGLYYQQNPSQLIQPIMQPQIAPNIVSQLTLPQQSYLNPTVDLQRQQQNSIIQLNQQHQLSTILQQNQLQEQSNLMQLNQQQPQSTIMQLNQQNQLNNMMQQNQQPQTSNMMQQNQLQQNQHLPQSSMKRQNQQQPYSSYIQERQYFNQGQTSDLVGYQYKAPGRSSANFDRNAQSRNSPNQLDSSQLENQRRLQKRESLNKLLQPKQKKVSYSYKTSENSRFSGLGHISRQKEFQQRH